MSAHHRITMTLHPATHPALHQDAPAGHLTILVVDDDALVREVTASMLQDAGHTVHEAADGVAALSVLMDHGRVDLLVTDINMPKMDGLELIRRAQVQWPDLPVLLVSGRPQPPGIESFMAKPFGWDALMHAVGRVVTRGAPPI